MESHGWEGKEEGLEGVERIGRGGLNYDNMVDKVLRQPRVYNHSREVEKTFKELNLL